MEFAEFMTKVKNKLEIVEQQDKEFQIHNGGPRDRKYSRGLCHRCHEPGHYVRECPLKTAKRVQSIPNIVDDQILGELPSQDLSTTTLQAAVEQIISHDITELLDIESRYSIWLHGRLQTIPAVITPLPSIPWTDAEITDALAMDCEGVGVGPKGKRNIVARVSIVNEHCEVVYDTYVKSPVDITDYRTWLTGIRKEDLENGTPLKDVILDVRKLLKGRKLVGHALHNDFRMLSYIHPEHLRRDTAEYDVFKCMTRKCQPSLRSLAKLVLGVNIQDGLHDSVVDARTAMQLYQKHKKVWEDSEYGWPELSAE